MRNRVFRFFAAELLVAALFAGRCFAAPVIIADRGDIFDGSHEDLLALLAYGDSAAEAAPPLLADGADATSASLPRRAAANVKGLQDAEVDVKVAPILKTAWAQDSVPVDSDSYYYNLCTPNHYLAGCVATAVAQVMYHHRYPVKAIPAQECVCEVDGTPTLLTTSGTAFDWDAMDLNPYDHLTEAGRTAVGTLVGDVAKALNSFFTASGTSAIIEDWDTTVRVGGKSRDVYYGVRHVLKDVFGYATCDEAADPSPEFMLDVIKRNLDEGWPVLAAIESKADGYNHQMVIDGYGYVDGVLYHHVNLGADDAGGAGLNIWYKLPDVYLFDRVWHLTYNITPPGTNQNPNPDPEPDPSGEHSLFSKSTDGAFSAAAASTYDGYLSKDGAIAGTVLVKAAKAAKDGSSKLTVTITPAGGKKVSARGAITPANPTLAFATAGGAQGSVTLGATGLSGEWNGYTIAGVRNRATSKVAAEKSVAVAKLSSLLGAYAIRLADGSILTVTVGAGGKTKIAATMANGAKDSAAAQLLLGETESCIPVAMKKSGISFAVWLGASAPAVEGIDALVGRPGNIADGATFALVGYTPADASLPVPEVAIGVKNGKWVLPKAGKVAYVKGTTEIDQAKAGDNPCALKLTYTAKTGAFKGSFKVYTPNGAKLKAANATVTGVVIGTKGYGTATIKGDGVYTATIE